MGDVPYGIVPGRKKREKMADRTSGWVETLIKDLKTEAGTAGHGNTEQSVGPSVFAPLLPVELVDQHEYLNYLADELVSDLGGLAFYDSKLLPDIPQTTSLAVLPRLSLDEANSPHEVLRQVSLGMDVFALPFISSATDAGIAFSFRLGEDFKEDSNGEIQPLGIDLWSPAHAADTSPLVPSCECYACSSHHRAYIQHLLSAKEMLGWVLLQIHNHAMMTSFFTSIRDSISRNSFEEAYEKFGRRYEVDLPLGSGAGPRVRGYQFKTGGPVDGKPQEKRNKPAWGILGGAGEVATNQGTSLVPDVGGAELEAHGFAEKV